MAQFIAIRIINLAIVLVVVSILIFVLSRAQGDPRNLYMDDYATQEQYESWGRLWGLDKPLWQQYLIWAGKAVRGQFGDSLTTRHDAREAVFARLPNTLKLAAAGFFVTLSVGVPLGILSAVRRGSIFDYIGRTVALFGQALPSFWLGVMLILLLSVQIRWLPTGGTGNWTHYVLPAITLGLHPAAGLLRLVRSSMLDVLDSEYIKFARAKGVGYRSIIWKHALRNAMIPPLTFMGLIIAGFITGAVVTETVFAWPGIGRLAITSIYNNDFSVVAAVVMLTAVAYVGVNTLVDILYAYVDPRITIK